MLASVVVLLLGLGGALWGPSTFDLTGSDSVPAHARCPILSSQSRSSLASVRTLGSSGIWAPSPVALSSVTLPGMPTGFARV